MSRFVWKGAITEGTEGTLTDDDDDEGEGEGEEEEAGHLTREGGRADRKEKDGGDEDDGNDSEDETEAVQTEAPAAIAGESLREYFARSADFWTRLADSVLREEEEGEEEEQAAASSGGKGAKSSARLTEKQGAKRLKEVRKRAFTLCEDAFA